jgi:hypothetical protein
MSQAQFPADSEVQSFLSGLKQYRDTLSETHQALLDAMVAAAVGKQKAEVEEDEFKPYWAAYVNPVGPAGGIGAGYAVATPYGAYGAAASPWGAAYGVRYY